MSWKISRIAFTDAIPGAVIPGAVIPGFVLSAILLSGSSALADWVTAPSYYTHDPIRGERVNQFQPIGPYYTYSRGDYQKSGYRHTRSSIQAGGSSDNLHIVEEWGREVRPYGEWRFPYRPYSVPYPAWGPTFPFGGPGFGGPGFGGPGFGGPGFGGPGFGGPGFGRRGYGAGTRYGNANTPANPPAVPPFQAYPGYRPQPWHDGRYAPYDPDGPYGHPDLLLRTPEELAP